MRHLQKLLILSAFIAAAWAQPQGPFRPNPNAPPSLVPGPGFQVSHIPFINSFGTVDAITGSPTNCIMVNGTTGPCGGPGGGTWGSITGTLSNQTDLQTSLVAKPTCVLQTTLGSPGVDANCVTEKAIRTAISGIVTSWGSITGSLASQSDLNTALNGKEPTIAGGGLNQYWRGDKTFQLLNFAALGGTLGLGQLVAHASTHQNGGSDEISTTTAAANAIPKANGLGYLNAGWLPPTTGNVIAISGSGPPSGVCTSGVGISVFFNVTPSPVDFWDCGPSGSWGKRVETDITGNNVSIAGNIAAGSETTGTGATNGVNCYGGSTSGEACIGVAALAGTPSKVLLPVSDPVAGQALLSNAPSGGASQLYWGSPTATMMGTTGQGWWDPWGAFDGTADITSTAYTANQVVMWEFLVPAQVIINKIDTLVNTGDNAKHFTFGIYNATAGALVTNGQFATATSNGSVNQALSLASPGAVTLTPGSYFLAFSTDSAATLKLYAHASGTMFELTINALETGTASRNFTCSNASTGTSTITLPASCGTRTVLSNAESGAPMKVIFLP